MKCKEIKADLDRRYPPALAESYDNPGLLVGWEDAEIQKIYLTLDVTGDCLDRAIAWGADLIISHHPMIFSGQKQIASGNFVGEKVLKMAEHRIACIAIHTNFDVAKMADINADLLHLTETSALEETGDREGEILGIGKVGILPKTMTLAECAAYVRDCFGLPQVKAFGDAHKVLTRAAICGGAGKSLLPGAIAKKADVYITGDIDHHAGLDAVDQGLAIIDAGHYGTEYFFMEQLKQDLEELDAGLEIACAPMEIPFQYY